MKATCIYCKEIIKPCNTELTQICRVQLQKSLSITKITQPCNVIYLLGACPNDQLKEVE